MPCNHQFISIHVVSSHFVELVVCHHAQRLSVQVLLKRLFLHFHVHATSASLESTDPSLDVISVHGSIDYALRSARHILMTLVQPQTLIKFEASVHGKLVREFDLVVEGGQPRPLH